MRETLGAGLFGMRTLSRRGAGRNGAIPEPFGFDHERVANLFGEGAQIAELAENEIGGGLRAVTSLPLPQNTRGGERANLRQAASLRSRDR